MSKIKLFSAFLLLIAPAFTHAQNTADQKKAILPVTDSNSSLTDISLSEVAIAAKGRKLPNIQQVSVRAPGDIKIDGSSAEWNNTFKAFNTATDVFYTLSNDDDNLYLIVKVTDPRTIFKIIESDIAFTVNPTGKKSRDNKNNMVFTYPLLDSNIRPRIVINAGLNVKPNINIGVRQGIQIDKYYSGFPPATDSMKAIANKLFAKNATEIKVKGIGEIPDTLLSVYNEKGIRVAATINQKGAYTYELAIPLKHLGISVENNPKFSYSIRLDAATKIGIHFGMSIRAEPLPGQKPSGAPFIYTNEDLLTTTDLWGDYTLIKK